VSISWCCCNPPRDVIVVYGCYNIPLAGCSVTLKDITTGTTVDSGTTDSSGKWDTTAAAGTYYIDFDKSPRFLTRTGETVTLNGTFHYYYMSGFVDTTNYNCFGKCADPVKNTLYYSDPTGPLTRTLTYNTTTTWVGEPAWTDGNAAILEYSWPACPAQYCPAISGTSGYSNFSYNVAILQSTGAALVRYSAYPTDGRPTYGQYCPYLSAPGSLVPSVQLSLDAFTCPDGGFALTYHSSDPILYCGTLTTIPVTE